MTGYVVVSTTADSEAEAGRLGRLAVEDRLAACAQVAGPIRSTYRWEGRIEHAEEWVCSAKTTDGGAQRLVQRWRAAHRYENPEIIVTPILAGSPDYLDWLDAESASEPAADPPR